MDTNKTIFMEGYKRGIYDFVEIISRERGRPHHDVEALWNRIIEDKYYELNYGPHKATCLIYICTCEEGLVQ